MNSTSTTRTLAGISVPRTPLVERALDYAHERCEPYLFNHVVRSWLFAERIGQLQMIERDAEVLAVGTLLHDITLNERFAGPRRFEVEAADLARGFATEAGIDKHRAQQVWDCVAEYEGILARGGTSGGDVRILGETVRYAFVCDPDGNHIEISQRASLTGGRL